MLLRNTRLPQVREGNGIPLQYSCLENLMDRGAWWAVVHGAAKSWTRLSDFTFTFHFHALEKEMATHSSVLAWRIPGMGEPGGLTSLGSHRVGHDWSNSAVAAAGFPGGLVINNLSACQCRILRRRGFNPWVRNILQRRKWQPTPVFLPGKSHGQRSVADYSPWGHKELDMTECTNMHPYRTLQVLIFKQSYKTAPIWTTWEKIVQKIHKLADYIFS